MFWIGNLIAALAMLAIGLTPAQAEQRVALVVGNSAYANTALLANPLNDARDVALALKAAGFEVIEALDADKRRLDGALRAFTERLAKADVALFYFAGHGLQVGQQNYLVPTDARIDRERDLEFETVRLDFVLRQMEIDREGRTSIVILDACRDNPLARNLARTMGTRSTAIGRGLAAAPTGLGTFIAYSTQPGNVALDGEGQRNSPFAAALVRQMAVRGRNLNATMIEVRKDVVAATGGRQVPWDHSALTGDFYFMPGPAAAAPAGSHADVAALQKRLKKLEDEAKKREVVVAVAPAVKSGPAFVARSGTRIEGDLLQAAPSTANCETRCQTESACVGYSLSRDGICELFSRVAQRVGDGNWRSGVRADVGASAAIPLPVPPVIPKSGLAKERPSFLSEENVRIDGTRISEQRQPSPLACQESCAKEASCVAYQHGRRSPMMGQCHLFSRIDTRQEDAGWRSGIRTPVVSLPLKSAAAPQTAALPARVAIPAPVARAKQGFNFYEKMSIAGDAIKTATVDSADGCMVVCRNTPRCVAANFDQPTPRSLAALAGPARIVYSTVTESQAAERATAIVRADP